MSLLFRKSWYSIDETIDLLNRHFDINQANNMIFNRGDIIQYFIDGFLRFTVRVESITERFLKFQELDYQQHNFELSDASLPIKDSKVKDFFFKSKFTDIFVSGPIPLQASGLFDIGKNAFRLEKAGLLVCALFPFNVIYENHYGPNKPVYIKSRKPFVIPFSQIIISRVDIVNTIKKIKEIGKNSALELEDQLEPSVNSTELQEEKAKNTQLQAENERLKEELKAQQDRMAELEQKLQQSAVDSKPVLGNAKAYDVRERETHLLMIGALSNLLAGYKQKYQKGNGGINQSAISKDIESEIIELLQPETKTRTNDTIRPRIRESLNLITKAE